MTKYLIVFNTCEINIPNLDWYIQCIDNLLETECDDTKFNFDLAISGCMLTDNTKKVLKEKYKDKAFLNYIDCRLPVNITFNHTVNKIVDKVGRYDGYVYFDSGVNVANDKHFLKEIHERFITGKYEMVSLQTDTDTGFWIFGLHGYFYDHDFVVPVGKACNLHVTCFGDTLLKQYRKILPDIFLAYCTESVFSFMTAALESRWVIIKDLILEHKKSVDGASAGFDHTGPKEPWNNLYGGLDMLDIIRDPNAQALGLGYEECHNILPHNPEKFTDRGFAKEPELKNYIRDKLFLQDDVLNYSHIPYEFYYEDKLNNSN